MTTHTDDRDGMSRTRFEFSADVNDKMKALQDAAYDAGYARGFLAAQAKIAELTAQRDELRESLGTYIRAIACGGGGDKDLLMAAIREADNEARATVARATGEQA